ncbi:HTH-type transcriptional regulator CdhR [Cognatishimia sp. WU-CL00825]|uniref:GlxA family transcriptional regulator n=1 Tax=Cognatishimia sp. WU-CL00825 TaxID=3127658 RepID=UPI00310A47C0
MREMLQSTLIRVIVTPNFNLAATMNFIDPFRAVNYLEGLSLFRWEIASDMGGPCVASNGVSIDTQALVNLDEVAPDITIVSSSWTPEDVSTARINKALRTAARAGKTIGGLDTGAFILAETGLMRGKRATVHYEHIDSFIELFPNIDVSENLSVFDGKFITCSGGVASVDFALRIIHSTLGPAISNAAARYIFHPEFRGAGKSQNPSGDEPMGANVPDTVKQAISEMEAHLEDPLTIPEISKNIGISQRQLIRLFSRYLNKTPVLYYRDIRLDRARGLVTQTTLSMAEIAVASGFSNQVHFSRAYRERFGLSPLQDRGEGRIPFEFRAWPLHRNPKGEA